MISQALPVLIHVAPLRPENIWSYNDIHENYARISMCDFYHQMHMCIKCALTGPINNSMQHLLAD